MEVSPSLSRGVLFRTQKTKTDWPFLPARSPLISTRPDRAIARERQQ